MTGDSVADNIDARKAYEAELAASITEDLERAGWSYTDQNDPSRMGLLNTDAAMDAQKPPGWVQRTACVSNTARTAPPQAGYTPLGPYHTHPYGANKLVPANCGQPPGTFALRQPSDEDYKAAAAIGKTMTIITPDDLIRVQSDGSTAYYRKSNPFCNWL